MVGRNADDCDEILEGLGDLLLQWDRREAKIEHTMVEANKVCPPQGLLPQTQNTRGRISNHTDRDTVLVADALPA